jgi:hypothetical protein
VKSLLERKVVFIVFKKRPQEAILKTNKNTWMTKACNELLEIAS